MIYHDKNRLNVNNNDDDYNNDDYNNNHNDMFHMLTIIAPHAKLTHVTRQNQIRDPRKSLVLIQGHLDFRAGTLLVSVFVWETVLAFYVFIQGPEFTDSTI